MFLFSSLNYSFSNKYFIEECFNPFVSKPFTVAIFYKNDFNFTNLLMEIRHARPYGKTAKINDRNKTELIIQQHVTIKMRVNTTESWVTVNPSSKNIIFSDNYNI